MQLIINIDDKIVDLFKKLKSGTDENGDLCYWIDENPGLFTLIGEELLWLDSDLQDRAYLTKLGIAIQRVIDY